MSELKEKTHTCQLCGTPFRPRREDEAFCCKGCAFVHGLVGQKGATPARMVKRGWLGSLWAWAAFFLFLAGLNLLIANTVRFSEVKAVALLYLLAALCGFISVGLLFSAVGRAGRSSR